MDTIINNKTVNRNIWIRLSYWRVLDFWKIEFDEIYLKIGRITDQNVDRNLMEWD